jgi:PRTRC genetic system protein E
MLASGTDVIITVSKQSAGLTVSVLPKATGLKDEAQTHLQPLVITGTPAELDAGFAEAIRQPVRKVAGLLTNMKAFEASVEKAEAQRKEAKENSKEAVKQAVKQDGKDKATYDSLMQQSEAKEAAGEFDEAMEFLRQAKLFAEKSEIVKLNDKITQLKAKCYQKELF